MTVTASASRPAPADATRGTRKSGRTVYAFADASIIPQDGGCERFRAEFGYVLDLTERLVLTRKLWIKEGNKSDRSSKIGVHFGPVDVSLGYREELGGQFDEHAVLVAVAARR